MELKNFDITEKVEGIEVVYQVNYENAIFAPTFTDFEEAKIEACKHAKHDMLTVDKLTWNSDLGEYESFAITQSELFWTYKGSFEQCGKDFGLIEIEGRKLALTEDAYVTNRVLPNVTNFNDVKYGEEFAFEMVASAINKDGKIYCIHWKFWDIKGEEKELDRYDYFDKNNIWFVD